MTRGCMGFMNMHRCPLFVTSHHSLISTLDCYLKDALAGAQLQTLEIIGLLVSPQVKCTIKALCWVWQANDGCPGWNLSDSSISAAYLLRPNTHCSEYSLFRSPSCHGLAWTINTPYFSLQLSFVISKSNLCLAFYLIKSYFIFHFDIMGLACACQLTSFCGLPSFGASYIHSSPSGQNGHHFTDDIFRCILMNEKFSILMKISLKFILRV